MQVIAEVWKTSISGWDIGGRSTKDQVVPANAVSRAPEMCLPMVGGGHLKGCKGACVLLVKKTYLAVAVDCERGVGRISNSQQIRRRPVYAAICRSTNMQRVIILADA